MEVRLVLIEGGKTVVVRPRLPTVIGRNTEADVQVPDSQVSRRHCELYDYEGQLAVRDVGSVNGTVVNGHKIEQDTFLSTGDTLTIGKVAFRIEVDAPDPQGLPPNENARQGDAGAAQSPTVTVDPESADSTVHSESAVLHYKTSDEGGSFIGISAPEGAAAASAESDEDEDDGLTDFLKGLGK